MKILIIVFWVLSTTIITAQIPDTLRKTIPTQYRRGVELQAGYQTYEQKYLGKNLNEEKRRLFPLESTEVWKELNPKVPRVDYIGIHFVNKDTGWACGDLGAIIKTTDGGQNWTVSETNTTSLILKIFSLDDQLVIATGYDGIILRSSDGGETFEQILSGVGTGIDLWGVQMVNDTLGWICGLYQTLLKTTDAGLTWQPVTAGLNQHYWSLDFLNENYGMVVCGNGVVLKTLDGGNNWTQIQTGDTRALYSIDIIDSLHIVAAGVWGNEIQYDGGKNVYSSDAGLSWVLNPDIPTYTDANWIEYIDADTGYSIMADQGIYKTTNRGQSWFGVGGGGEWQLVLTEDGTGYSGGDGLNIYKRTNGIENWSRIILNDNFSDVFFISEQKGFAISWSGLSIPSGLYKTTNGGESWEKVSGAPNGSEILFLDSLTGFIGGNSIYMTTDGGENWYIPNGGSVGARKIFFIDDSIGWAIGSNIIYKTIDRGENWSAQFSGTDNFTSIFFIDTLNGWATSDYIWQTTNGGDNWVERIDIPILLPNDIYFVNPSNGWIISGNELYYTTNSGSNWILDPQIYTYSLNFEAISDSHYIITGSNIYESVDSGQVWGNITSQVGSGFSSLQAPRNYLAYGVGTLGYIVSYLDTSIVPVELINFSAEYSDNKIDLCWVTATEKNNYGFEIFKSTDSVNWTKIGFVSGKGTSTKNSYYSISDLDINGKKIFYRLKQIDYNGIFKYSKIIEIDIIDPIQFSLKQNYPNPFNLETNISFNIPIETYLNIKLYDVTGREIKILVNEKKQPGYYTIKLKGGELSSGVYFYRLTTSSGFTSVKKLILLK